MWLVFCDHGIRDVTKGNQCICDKNTDGLRSMIQSLPYIGNDFAIPHEVFLEKMLLTSVMHILVIVWSRFVVS